MVVISETAARQYWPGENPIGREVVRPSREQAYRVVGDAKDTKVWTLGEEYRPYIYLSKDQAGEVSSQIVATGSIPEAQIVCINNHDIGQLRSVAPCRQQ